MPAERAPMRKVREVLRLRHALGVSERQIAVTLGISRSTVGEYLRRAAVIGITWPVPEGMDDGELERRLFTPPTFEEKPARPLPDWTVVHRELKRRSVTLLLLWEEYRAEHADGYGYSRFCDLYREWSETISPTMRQAHGPGEKLFVDFAGDTVPVFEEAVDPGFGAGAGLSEVAQWPRLDWPEPRLQAAWHHNIVCGARSRHRKNHRCAFKTPSPRRVSRFHEQRYRGLSGPTASRHPRQPQHPQEE